MRLSLIAILLLAAFTAKAQPADSLVAEAMRQDGVVFTDGNSVRLFPSGAEKFEDMFAELEKAKVFIHMEYFNFRNDSINAQLLELLERKVREGVEVRIMYDAFGNSSNNRPIRRAKHDSIAATGIQIVKFDPIRFPWINHIIPRDHRKIVVIDGRVAYTGGMNVADYYITGIEGIGPWHDMHMHVEGPAVNELHKIFCTMWYKATDSILVGSKYYPEPILQKENVRMGIVDRAPRYTNRAIRQLYCHMIDNAQFSIRLINPYFAPTHRVRRSLKRAVKRGVNVEILLSEKSDIPLTPDASHYVGNNLAKRGATVYMYQGGFHHTKIMLIDHSFCTIGSSNLDSRSLRCDYEINTLILDNNITHQLDSLFDHEIQSAFVLEKGYWKTRTPWKRFVGWFGNLLTPVL